MRILVVEDEYKIADLVKNRLEKEKYAVDLALDGEDGLDRALDNVYDLIILDVMLPKKSGPEILRELKGRRITAGIIMLTAKSSLEDKLESFSSGADDYITKPFHLEELVARVNARLRKSGSKNPYLLSFGDLNLDLKKSLLTCVDTDEEIGAVRKELAILEYLIRSANQIVSKDFLYDNVWGVESDTLSNSLEAYVSFIRKKLKAIGSRVTVKAVRGLGYKMEMCDEKIKE